MVNGFGSDYLKTFCAHNLGQNLNMQNDENTACSDNPGLMGSSAVPGDVFTTCSIEAVQKFFNDSNGLVCLGDGVRSFTSNVMPTMVCQYK